MLQIASSNRICDTSRAILEGLVDDMLSQPELGRLLKRHRESCGLSQGDLAKLVDMDRTSINSVENGKRGLSEKSARRIARVLHVDPREYIGEEPPTPEPDIETLLRKAQAKISELPRKIPILGDASAGPGSTGDQFTYWDGIKAAEPYIIAVRVSGTCLEPEVKDGDKVIANTQETPQDGDLVVCLVDGSRMVKRYRQKDGEKWLENGRGRISFEECNLQGVVVEVHHRRR